jgi:hypothetical protein
MTKDDPSTPIVNLLATNPEAFDRWRAEYLRVHLTAQDHKTNSCGLHWAKLGRHHRTMISGDRERLYIWDFDRYRIFAGHRMGFTFEVAMDVTPDEALKLWDEHRAKLEGRNVGGQ